jgi:hypothetical protein
VRRAHVVVDGHEISFEPLCATPGISRGWQPDPGSVGRPIPGCPSAASAARSPGCRSAASAARLSLGSVGRPAAGLSLGSVGRPVAGCRRSIAGLYLGRSIAGLSLGSVGRPIAEQPTSEIFA